MKLVPVMWFSVALVSVMLWYGCSRTEPGRSPSTKSKNAISSLETRPVLKIGFLSVSRIHAAYDSYAPLAEYLTAHTPYRFRIIIPQTSEDLVGFLEERTTEVAFLGVLDYIDAHRQYGAVALVKPLNRDREPVSRSVFITREDSQLDALSELPGHSLALSSYHSTWGNLIPRYGLMRAGIRLEALKSVDNLSEEDEVVQSVLDGRAEVGAVKDVVAFRRKGDGLRWLHVSDSIPTGPMAIRPDLPTPVVQAILRALLTLAPEDAENRSGWNEEIRHGFVRATDADYDPIRKMLTSRPTGCEGQCHHQVAF
jgi:phosphonate transport system substrate-binding protein